MHALEQKAQTLELANRIQRDNTEANESYQRELDEKAAF
jgi:hypothetical protein